MTEDREQDESLEEEEGRESWIERSAGQVSEKAYQLYQQLKRQSEATSDKPSIDELLKGKGGSGRVRIYQAIKPDGSVLWPEERPIEYLARERASMLESNFNAQYQNDPSGMTGVMLDIGWLNYYNENDIPDLAPMIGSQGADPATSEKERANNFGHCTAARDPQTGTIYVLGFAFDKLPAPKHEEFMRLQFIHWALQGLSIREVKYETQGPAQGSAQFLMESNRANDTLSLPLTAEPAKGKKEDRIMSLKPHLGNGTILFPGHINLDGEWELKQDTGFNEFKKEYMSYPVGGRDDLLDALFLAVDPLLMTGPAAAIMMKAPQAAQMAKKAKQFFMPGQKQPPYEDEKLDEYRQTPTQVRQRMLRRGVGGGVYGSHFGPQFGMVARMQNNVPQAIQRMRECHCVPHDRCFDGCNCFHICQCQYDCGCKMPRYLPEHDRERVT